MPRTFLVTGATGFVGSHVAEALVNRGDAVRAIVRAGSDTALLEKLGVQLFRGDLTDADVLRQAADGVDPGHVVTTFQAGFILREGEVERVIRPAKVSVAP